jgi:hypothetical protein
MSVWRQHYLRILNKVGIVWLSNSQVSKEEDPEKERKPGLNESLGNLVGKEK